MNEEELILLTLKMNTLSLKHRKRKRVCISMTDDCLEENIAKRRKLEIKRLKKRERIRCKLCQKIYTKANKTFHIRSKYHQNRIKRGKICQKQYKGK